eukprot:m.47966 g.47966  ORF g.47966 m.47966 type:complete len:67 (+) comp33847_c0_seq1:780-980(+)
MFMKGEDAYPFMDGVNVFVGNLTTNGGGDNVLCGDWFAANYTSMATEIEIICNPAARTWHLHLHLK